MVVVMSQCPVLLERTYSTSTVTTRQVMSAAVRVHSGTTKTSTVWMSVFAVPHCTPSLVSQKLQRHVLVCYFQWIKWKIRYGELYIQVWSAVRGCGSLSRNKTWKIIFCWTKKCIIMFMSCPIIFCIIVLEPLSYLWCINFGGKRNPLT